MSERVLAGAAKRVEGLPPLTPQTLAEGLAAPVRQRLRAVEERLSLSLQGKPEVVQSALITLLARGHLLIEDVPGVGKTTLGLALAGALGCSFARVQFTSDLLPADIVGSSLFDQRHARFEFRPGPVFHHIVLADELNRTTPKTQSCLLEAMSEGRVSVDGITHALPEPFMVIATQNPIEHHGTYPLPESQLDRFMMRLRVGYPERDAERLILRGVQRASPGTVAPLLSPEEVMALQNLVPQVTCSPLVEDYLLAIVRQTREQSRLALGVSPRGAQQLFRASQARALLEGRSFVTPDDVKRLAIQVLSHRLIPVELVGLSVPAEESTRIMRELLERVPVPV